MSPVLSRRRFLGATAAASLSAALAACGTSSRAAASGPVDLSTVTLRVGDQVKASQSALQAAGELTGVPYQLEWSSFTAGPPLLEALNAGAIDIGGVGDSPPVLAQAAGIEARIVSTQRRDKPNDFLLATPGSNVQRVTDLKGKRVAVAKGSSSHGLLLGLLADAGVALGDVTVSYLAPPDAQSAFAAGQVDAWAVWNPYAAVATQTAGARLVADGATQSTGQAYDVASTAALDDPGKAAAVADYLARLVRARNWTTAHPDQWVPIYAQLTTLPEAVASVTFDTSQGRGIAIDDAVISRQQTLADRFATAGVIPSEVDVSKFFDARFNSVVTAAQP